MNLFVVILAYAKPLEEVDRFVTEHRAYLDRCYAEGLFLMSGPQVPRRGGVIVARCETRARLEQVLAADPFHSAGCARYEVIEFQATKRSAAIAAALGLPA